MLDNDLDNKELQNKLVSYIESTALPEFLNGDYSYLSLIYDVFKFSDAIECHKLVGKEIYKLFCNISMKDLIKLSENCRRSFFGYFLNEGQEKLFYKIKYNSFKFERNKFKYLSDEEYVSILRLGTWHQNGFYRENCMKCLIEYENNLPFYILRLNDWVDNIRALAYEFAMKEIVNDDIFVIFAALPMIDKVKNSGRREKEYIDEISALAKNVIIESLPKCSIYDISRSDIVIKKIIYKYLYEKNILTLDKMKQLLNMEKTGYCKGLIFDAILKNYELSMEEIDEYLLSKNTIVKFKALECKYKKLKKPWSGIELMLLDKSRRIRENVSFILSRDGSLNVLEYYKNELEINNNPIAILGIGECGSTKDVDLILSYLKSDNEVIVKKALKAYGMLMTFNGSETYWEYLFSNSDLLCNEAYRLIRKYNVYYGGTQLFEAYKKNPDSKIADKLVLLLLREGIWSNLKYLLMLYDDKNLPDNLLGLIKMKISLRNNYFVSLSWKQKEEIIDVLGRKVNLPNKLVDEILFDLDHI